MDKRRLRTCGYTDYKTLERLGGGTVTKGDLNSTHLGFVAKQCKLQVWESYMSTPSKFPSCQSLSWFENGVSSCILLYKKSLAFDIKRSPSGRSPKDHQVRAHGLMLISLGIKFNHATCKPLYVLVYSSLNVCLETHSQVF